MLEEFNKHLVVKVEALEEEVLQLRRMLFGKKSEKVEPKEEQGKIVFEEEAQDPISTPTEPTPSHPADAKPADSQKKQCQMKATVVREVEHLVIPEEVQTNPQAYTRLPESSDRISRRLEYVPSHFELHIFRMPAFVKRGQRGKSGQDAPIHATAPQNILPGSNMGASVIALALHNKYSLHLPLYRQIKEFERIGLHGLSGGVLCNWVRAVAEELEPLWKAHHELLLDSEALQSVLQ